MTWLLWACSSSSPHSPSESAAGGGGTGGDENTPPLVTVLDAGPMPTTRGPCDSTFQAIARTIFEGTGCTGVVCHTTPGPDTPAAGLDLTLADAYADLVGVAPRSSVGSTYLRVEPGDETASLLYLKVAAAEPMGAPLPDGGGAPMPLGLPPLAADQIVLLRTWIRGGAPESGVVDGTGDAVSACLASGK
jgi:hypothetical protein